MSGVAVSGLSLEGILELLELFRMRAVFRVWSSLQGERAGPASLLMLCHGDGGINQ